MFIPLAALIVLGSLLSSGPPPAPRMAVDKLEASEEIMGSDFSLVLHGDSRPQLERAAAAAFDEVRRLDRLLSNYRPESEWSAMNRTAATAPVRLSEELFAFLSSCLQYSEASDGAFDITVGPLMKTWGFFKGEGRLATPAAVRAALTRVGYRHVALDATARTVRFTRPGVELDPGGIGKGYAVDRMVDVLERHGVTTALVSAAGSSIFGLGAPPDDPRGWAITVRAPGHPERAVTEVFLKNASLSTSGSYEKFFWAEGRTYAHIIDPRTGYPARGTASVSVLAARAIDSEAWTKPFFIHGRAWTRRYRPAAMRVFICDDAPQPACGWTDDPR